MMPGTAEYARQDEPRHQRRHSGFGGQMKAVVGLCTETSSEGGESCLVDVGQTAGGLSVATQVS